MYHYVYDYVYFWYTHIHTFLKLYLTLTMNEDNSPVINVMKKENKAFVSLLPSMYPITHILNKSTVYFV